MPKPQIITDTAGERRIVCKESSEKVIIKIIIMIKKTPSMLMLPFAVEKCKCHKAKRQGEAANTHRQTEARDTVIRECSPLSVPLAP